MLRVMLFAMTVLISSQSALAECTVSRLSPWFANEAVRAWAMIRNARICNHVFLFVSQTNGLASASIIAPPRSGVLIKTGRSSFRYIANVGFKGRDAYSVRLCRSDGGCSNINYETTVE